MKAKAKEEDARCRLLAAAGPIFANQGYEKATVRDICGAASVNIASVGYYFGDKLGLYREVLRSIRDHKSQRFPIPEASEFEDPQQRLLAFVSTLLGRMLSEGEEGWQVQLLMREMQDPTEALDDILKDHFSPVFEELVDTIASILDQPVARTELDHLALSVIGQCFHYRVGKNTIHRLVSRQSLDSLKDIDTLALHITGVTLAAISGCGYKIQQDKLQKQIR